MKWSFNLSKLVRQTDTVFTVCKLLINRIQAVWTTGESIKDLSVGDQWYPAVQYLVELACCRVLVNLTTLSRNTYIKGPSQKGRRQSVVVGTRVNACWKCLKLRDKYSVPLTILYIHSTFFERSDPKCYSRSINAFSTDPFFFLKCLQYVEGYVSVGQQ